MKKTIGLLYLLILILILAACGSTTTYPDEKFTSEPSLEGGYVMSLTNDGLLVVSAKPDDFSDTGGKSEFYNAIYYHYPNAVEQVELGQRVRVEMTGPVAESYPGQATAKSIEVLPEYKPQGARLSEAKVIQQMLEQYESDTLIIIRSITFQQEKSLWKIKIIDGEKDLEIELKDE